MRSSIIGSIWPPFEVPGVVSEALETLATFVERRATLIELYRLKEYSQLYISTCPRRCTT